MSSRTATEMAITLDSERVAPGTTVRGRVADPPAGRVEVSLVATTHTPFGERREVASSVESTGPEFALDSPWGPATWRGDLITTEWTVEARAPTGAVAAAPIELGADDLIVESVDDDDLDGPPVPFDRRLSLLAGLGLVASLTGVVTAFGTGHAALRYVCGFAAYFAIVALSRAAVLARRHAVVGTVRCRVEPVGDELVCIVAAGRPGGLPSGTTATATLLIVELAGHSRPGRAAVEHERVVVERNAWLEPSDDGTWRGAIPLATAPAAPPSQHGDEGATVWSITWVVRIVIDAPRTPRFTRVMPLVALPTGVDPSLRPRYVDIPRAAR